MVELLGFKIKQCDAMNETYCKIMENYIDAYNTFDIDRMILDVDRDIKFQNITNNNIDMEINGVENFKDQAIKSKHLFKEREQKIINMEFTGNQVKVDISYHGILASDLPNGLKAGDKIELKGVSIFIFNDNKIVEILTALNAD